jgi:hypothetical protein
MYYTATTTGECLVLTELTCVGIRNSCAGVSARTVSITGFPVFYSVVIIILIVTICNRFTGLKRVYYGAVIGMGGY